MKILALINSDKQLKNNNISTTYLTNYSRNNLIKDAQESSWTKSSNANQTNLATVGLQTPIEEKDNFI